MLMFQVPGGGGYCMNYQDVMNLSLDVRDFLIEYMSEEFDKYNNEVSKI